MTHIMNQYAMITDCTIVLSYPESSIEHPEEHRPQLGHPLVVTFDSYRKLGFVALWSLAGLLYNCS